MRKLEEITQKLNYMRARPMFIKFYSYLFGKEVHNYGIARIVKELAGVPKWLPFPVEIHHGWNPSEVPRHSDLRSDTPFILVYNTRQKLGWDRVSEKPSYVLGAPFVRYRRKLGIGRAENPKGTLALPVHNATSVIVKYDIESYCRKLLSLPDEFHPITVCLHYDDIRRGVDQKYRDLGFKVVSAGHRHDSNFCVNFYNIIGEYKYATSNSLATAAMLCVEMGVPFFILKEDYFVVDENSNVVRESADFKPDFLIESQKLFEADRLSTVEINEIQRKFVYGELGVNESIGEKELKKLIYRTTLTYTVPRFLYSLTVRPARFLLRFAFRGARSGFKRAVLVLKRSSSRVPVRLAKGYRATIIGSEGFHVFFGYDDITPFSRDGGRLLACRVPSSCVNACTELMDVGCYDLETLNFRVLDQTSAWCWQQACRLQWHPAINDTVIYNKVIGGKYRAVCRNVETASEAILERPIYSISPDGRFAVSLDFARLQRLRPGYGYGTIPDATAGVLQPKDSGLWLMDLESGLTRLVLSVSEIAAWNATPEMREAEHYFNHVTWNPSSSCFLFFHLWVMPNGNRKARVFSWNRERMDFVPIATEGHASHGAWINSNELIMYATHSKTGTYFHKYNIETSGFIPFLKDKIREDHHLMGSLCGSGKLLFDSYPDRIFSRRHLKVYYEADHTLKNIASFYSPPEMRGEYRCDLHARWDWAGNRICVDSAHDGVRKMVIIGKQI